MACALGAFDPAQVIAQLAFTLRVAHCRLLKCLQGLPCALQALRELLLRGRRSAQLSASAASARAASNRKSSACVWLRASTACNVCSRPRWALASSAATARTARNPLLRTQLPALQGALGLAQAPLDGLRQCFLAGGQISMAGIELARTLQ